MNKYDFTNIGDQLNVGSVKHHSKLIEKFFKLRYYEDSLSLWVSEMDFKMSPEIEKAIVERTEKGILGYTAEDDEYFKNVMNWLEYKHNAKVKRNQIVPSAGTVHAIRNALRAFTSEGDRVIIQTPVYGQFAAQIEGTKRIIANNPLVNNGEYKIDFEGFEELAKQKDVKMFILCNPHNPTGNIWTREEVIKLVEICDENDVIVFSDEVHGEIIREGVEFVSTATMNYDNLITAFGLGKAFNLTGIHITNLVIKNRALRETFQAYTGFGTSSPITLAALDGAYNHSKEWLKEVNGVIDSNLDYIDEFIKENLPKVKFRKPLGTYLVWLDISEYGLKSQKVTELIAEGKVILEAGQAFGEEGEGYVRMMSATPRPRLVEAMNRIKDVLDSLE